MEKHFNLVRYKELLKLQENGEISFLDFELLSFKASVAQQICYNRKKDYFIVIDEYLSLIILEPGQKGAPDQIVGIVKRSRLNDLMKTFKKKFK